MRRIRCNIYTTNSHKQFNKNETFSLLRFIYRKILTRILFSSSRIALI